MWDDEAALTVGKRYEVRVFQCDPDGLFEWVNLANQNLW